MRDLPSAVCVTCLIIASACNTADRLPSSAGADADRRPAPVMRMVTTCQGDCVAILRAGISWLSDTLSVAPTAIMLDTVRSGVRYTAPGVRTRVVPRSVLDRLTASTGMHQVNGDAMGRCFRKRAAIRAECRPLEHNILLRFMPPSLSMEDSTDAALDIWYHRNLYYPDLPPEPGQSIYRFWAGKEYRLTLRRGPNGWRVVGARLVEMS